MELGEIIKGDSQGGEAQLLLEELQLCLRVSLGDRAVGGELGTVLPCTSEEERLPEEMGQCRQDC